MEKVKLDLVEEEIAPSLYMSVPKKKIPIPKIPFEKFIRKFKNFEEIMATKEWKEIYSNYYSFTEDEKKIKINETKEELENYSYQEQLEELKKCAKSFTYFCLKYAKISHPTFGIINFILYNYQKRVLECYGKHRFNILSKFRQGGLTTVTVAWALWRCIFKTSQKIMVVSKTDREAITAGSIAKTILDYLPSWLKPTMEEDNKHEKHFKDTTSSLCFYTVEAARGRSITILIIDEAAFIKDMDEHWKALYPVISTGGAVAMISTVNGIGNCYHTIYSEAESGKNPFNIIEIDYWEHPLYNDPQWIKDTYEVLGEKGWKQEIERNFLGSGATWLNALLVKEIYENTREHFPKRQAFSEYKKNSTRGNKIPYDNGALWIWQEPIKNNEYIISVDTAEGIGEDGDFNSFEILDQNTLEQVAEFYSNSVSPHIFAQIINQIGMYYNTGLVVVENNSYGTVVLTALQHDLGYENLYYEDQSSNSVGIKPNKNKRVLILQSLQEKIVNNKLKIHSNRFANELSTFIINPRSKKPEASRGRHDDLIISMAMACFVRDQMYRNLPIGSNIPEETLEFYRSQTYEQIKQEIISNSNDFIWRDDEDEVPFYLNNNIDDEIINKYKRKNDSLLKEFGW